MSSANWHDPGIACCPDRPHCLGLCQPASPASQYTCFVSDHDLWSGWRKSGSPFPLASTAGSAKSKTAIRTAELEAPWSSGLSPSAFVRDKVREGGGLTSSAWHIDKMGPPRCLDVWTCAQSNGQWWMSIRSAGGACSCS